MCHCSRGHIVQYFLFLGLFRHYIHLMVRHCTVCRFICIFDVCCIYHVPDAQRTSRQSIISYKQFSCWLAAGMQIARCTLNLVMVFVVLLHWSSLSHILSFSMTKSNWSNPLPPYSELLDSVMAVVFLFFRFCEVSMIVWFGMQHIKFTCGRNVEKNLHILLYGMLFLMYASVKTHCVHNLHDWHS